MTPPTLYLAPLAGVTDDAFRRICKRFGADVLCTEMVSAKGLFYNDRKTARLMTFDRSGRPTGIQLFGHEPEIMADAVKKASGLQPDFIDINMGCPMPKIVNNGDGSALMKNPALITEIVQAVREGAKRPVTVKMRAGVESGKPLAVECALAAQRGGASAVCIHPRYREQFYSGEADHLITKAVKESLDIPVIANGDIVDAASLDRVATLTHADGYMIGRGALGRPWIFAELTGKDATHDVKSDIYEHIAVLRKYMSDFTVANVMKLQLCYYAKGGRDAKAVRVEIGKAKTVDDIFSIIETHFP